MRILVAGYYGYQNSGDDAILHSICRDIRKINEDISITVLSNQPNLTATEYKVKAVNRFSFQAVKKSIKECDVLVMGGGTLIQDLTSTRSLYYYLGILWMARFYKKETMLYGNGIGPLKHWYNIPLTRFTLNKVNTITLREHLSAEALRKFKINRPTIAITADPVFNLHIEEDIPLEDLYDIEGIPRDKKLVAVLFRSWSHEDSYTKRMARVCDTIIEEKGMHIVFVPMKYPSDLVVSLEILKKMKHKASVIEEKYQEAKIIQFLGEANLILSMRLHALIYGALNDVPMLGFNYDPKVEYYAKELGIPYIEDMRHIHVDEVLEKIDEIFQDKDNLKERMHGRVGELKEKARENRHYLEKILNKIND